MQEYQDLVRAVLTNGVRKENRTGVDTLSLFNYNYKIDLRRGFPLLTTKEISWKNIVIENLWFLSGSTSLDLLRSYDIKFWDAWEIDKRVPSAYGSFWRSFEGERLLNNVDQVHEVVRMLKDTPMSRRMVITAWDPRNALYSKLPPCHLMYILNVEPAQDGGPDYLNLHLTQRSADIALGVPYNIAGYAFIASLFARFANLRVKYFAHSIVDAHVYTAKPDGSMGEYDHIPNLKIQLLRDARDLPELVIDPSIQNLEDLQPFYTGTKPIEEVLNTFRLVGYNPNGRLNFKVAV